MHTTFKGTYYLVKFRNKEIIVHKPVIDYNMVCLYTIEPHNRETIYSDKYHSFLFIQKIKAHHYKIQFPDGNYNEYFYENGRCTSIKVESSMYSVIMVLKK
jgi:hypothetical protein